MGISVGTATYGADGETLDQLLITADQAMYSAKSEHKQRRRTRALIAPTTSTDKREEVEPVVDLETGTLTSAAIN